MMNVKPETMGSVDHEYYPSFTVPISSIPQAKQWKVGKSYGVALSVKQVRVSEDENSSTVTFEVRKIAPIRKDESKVAINTNSDRVGTSDGYIPK